MRMSIRLPFTHYFRNEVWLDRLDKLKLKIVKYSLLRVLFISLCLFNMISHVSASSISEQPDFNLKVKARKQTSSVYSELPGLANDSSIKINLFNVQTGNARKRLVRGKSQLSIDNGNQGGKGPKRPLFPVKCQQSSAFEAHRVGAFPDCPIFSRLFGPGPKCPAQPPFVPNS